MSRRIVNTLFASALALGAIGHGQSAMATSSGKFVVEGSEKSRVQFVSDAPLEKITGVGHKLTGNLEFDPAALDKAKGTIKLAVKSINTNVDLRDEHLRGPDWLDAKKYPTIDFKIVKIQGAKALPPGKAVKVKIKGKVTMHGVTRDETATATLRHTPGKGVKVKANFKVKLPKYKISVNPAVRLKVSDEIELNVMLNVKPKK